MRTRDRLLQVLPTINVDAIYPDTPDGRGDRGILRRTLAAAVNALEYKAVDRVPDIIKSRIHDFPSDHIRELLTEAVWHMENENG